MVPVQAQTLTSTTEQIECGYTRDLFHELDICDKAKRGCEATLVTCNMDKQGLHLLISQQQRLIESPPKPPEPEQHTSIILISVISIVSVALGFLAAKAL